MSNRPSMCVVTPSYQQGRFIERTVKSVLSQGIEDLDYVVVDGGSRDQTVEILKRFEGQLRYVSEADDGQADAVNKGIEATHGEIICWLNSDDVYYEGALEAVRSHFAEHPEVDVVYGQAEHIDENDGFLEPYPSEPWDRERLLETCFICQPATFIRRSALERHGLLAKDLRYCMDYELWLRLSQGGASFSYLERMLAGSRLYSQNKTLGERKAVHREINDMFRRTVSKVPDRWLTNWAHAMLEDRGLSHDKTPVRFTLRVSALSWWAALRWNQRVSPELRQLTGSWIRGNVWPNLFRGANHAGE